MFKKLIILFSVFIILTSCRSGRPDMAKEQKDGGAVQDIEIFNVKSSAENFRGTTEEFAKDVEEIQKVEKKPLKRRISLNKTDDVKKSTSLKIVDHNSFVKKLETSEVSLKLNNMDIKSALKLFAGLAQRNIIIGDEVGGNITIDFENIRWGSAVYALLDINNLIMTEDKDSGLLRVHSQDVFKELEKNKIERTLEVNKNLLTLENGGNADTDAETERLVITEIFKVFHQTSAEVIEPIQSILGEETEIQFVDDAANNQLLVKGTPDELNRVEQLLDQVDIEKKQVLIEAYIINASDTFQENFNNRLEAVNASQLENGRDGIVYTGVSTNPGQDGFAFNIDTTTETGPIGSTGFPDETLAGGAVLIGNIGITRLKAVINMSINDKLSETISNPKLFAMDGETATLTQGKTLLKVIPAAGDAAASTVEVPQNLTIEVTPDVIGDSKVKLELTLNNDKPGDATGSDVATDEESLTSIVLLETGQVAVLGGVYVNTKNDNDNFVPFFSKIPLLGTFFKSQTKQDDRTQLLIFVSANIV